MKFSPISDLATVGLPLGSSLAVLSLVLTALFIRWRTGSSLTILARLWNLFHGKTSVTVPFIRDHLDSLSSVMKLRFTTGAPVRTEQHALRLTCWSDSHEENLIDAVRCGRYFDFDRPGLKERSEQPRPVVMFTMGAALVTLLVGIAALTVLFVPERAILKLNATGTWFTLDNDSARPFGSGQGILLAHCGKIAGDEVAASGFTTAEVNILCDTVKTMTTAEISTYVSHNIKSQRGLFILSILVLMWWTLPILSALRHCANANAMRERLRLKASVLSANSAAQATATQIAAPAASTVRSDPAAEAEANAGGDVEADEQDQARWR